MIPCGFFWLFRVPGWLFMIPGVFIVIHGSRLVFQVSLFLSWASEAQSETLRTPQKVPAWSVSWPHDPARQALPVVGRLWPSEDGDGGGGEDDNKVEEGGQVLLRCNPGGACLKNGCTWTFPGMRNKIWLLVFALDNGHHLFTKYITTNVSCGSIPFITNCCESEPLTS